MTDYLTVVEVLAMHEELITRYGGAEGARDLGLLEAALFRPQTGYYADLIAEAAALWESLSQNHAFVDGNKRVAFGVMNVFLDVNGVELTADWAAAWEFLAAVYDRGEVRFETLEAWLRSHTQSG